MTVQIKVNYFQPRVGNIFAPEDKNANNKFMICEHLINSVPIKYFLDK